MLFITTAMQPEARPLIAALGLKKNHSVTRFRVYDSHTCALTVSGTGKIRSAVATTFMLTHYNTSQKDLWVNTGVCGAAGPDVSRGGVFLVNRIRDNDTGRDMFPDLLYRHDFPEASLETFSSPVSSGADMDFHTMLVDMEASGAFEAARAFLPPHRVAVIKVVLDSLEPDSFKRQDVEETMKSVTGLITDWICRISGCDTCGGRGKEESSPACRLWKSSADRMDLSESLRVEFDHMMKYLCAADPEGSSPAALMPGSLMERPERITRKEAKRLISSLRREIRALPVPL